MKDFAKQLRKLGINPGDVVMMHSSMKALKTDKTPEEFIGDVQSVIGEQGTLLVPAFTWNMEGTHFSARETEPCDGLIPRSFLRMPGVVRSLHPTHSVSVWGKLAEELTAKHHLDNNGCGPNCPFARLPELSGKILFIGDILNSCSFMHCLEHALQMPYHRTEPVHYTIEDTQGDLIQYNGVSYKNNPPETSWGAEFQRIKKVLKWPDIKRGKVGKATCFLVDATALQAKATAALQRDPYYFVSDITAYMQKEQA